ncbi:MAG TPA: 4-(cytidine 5'-diphospho)-2-C-methyl-D-erythritol kinase [Acidimicrobiia bacterium]|nr:4-(cytidine 5'-diphospho)-2-C-methyl-D-erythritol kinase [Acidimicrobiia bacterium]
MTDASAASVWEAPAKLNLSLEVRPPDRSGYHPVRSLCQTIEYVDLLTIGTGEDERLVVEGFGVSDGEDNLVWKAARCLVGRPDRPRLDMHLAKRIPPAAGLGGGSADAAAALLGVAQLFGGDAADVARCAIEVGSDVPYFLRGGSMWMEGRGEILTEVEPLAGFSVAVAVPEIAIPTAAAYARWDELGAPSGPDFPQRRLPPSLRSFHPLRNDLTPAALSLEPALGDWAAELAQRWGTAVAMSGSGSAHFAFFPDVDEATEAALAVADVRSAFAATLRGTGSTSR